LSGYLNLILITHISYLSFAPYQNPKGQFIIILRTGITSPAHFQRFNKKHYHTSLCFLTNVTSNYNSPNFQDTYFRLLTDVTQASNKMRAVASHENCKLLIHNNHSSLFTLVKLLLLTVCSINNKAFEFYKGITVPLKIVHDNLKIMIDMVFT